VSDSVGCQKCMGYDEYNVQRLIGQNGMCRVLQLASNGLCALRKSFWCEKYVWCESVWTVGLCGVLILCGVWILCVI